MGSLLFRGGGQDGRFGQVLTEHTLGLACRTGGFGSHSSVLGPGRGRQVGTRGGCTNVGWVSADWLPRDISLCKLLLPFQRSHPFQAFLQPGPWFLGSVGSMWVPQAGLKSITQSALHRGVQSEPSGDGHEGPAVPLPGQWFRGGGCGPQYLGSC